MQEGRWQVEMYEAEDCAEAMWIEEHNNVIDSMAAVANTMLEWIENNEAEEGLTIFAVFYGKDGNDDPNTVAGWKFTNMAWQPYTKDQIRDINNDFSY